AGATTVDKALRALERRGLVERGGPGRPTIIATGTPRPQRTVVTVAAELRRLITAGEWPPGAALPSSETLAERLGASSKTVARALGPLSDDGVVVRPGPGRAVLVAGVPVLSVP